MGITSELNNEWSARLAEYPAPIAVITRIQWNIIDRLRTVAPTSRISPFFNCGIASRVATADKGRVHPPYQDGNQERYFSWISLAVCGAARRKKRFSQPITTLEQQTTANMSPAGRPSGQGFQQVDFVPVGGQRRSEIIP